MIVVAIDIGGTFTDLIGFDQASGQFVQAKSLTTPAQLGQGVIDCIRKSGLAAAAIDELIHGSTIAINTLIERKGAKTGLIVTGGTRDVYIIGRGNRPEAYNLLFHRHRPLVPRHLTREVNERLLSSGAVYAPLDRAGIAQACRALAAEGVEAVAVCFLHSYVNPAHERIAGEMIRAAMPDAYLSLSHEILREYREFERMSTTVVNAYIGPKVGGYVKSLNASLGNIGFRGALSIMRSNGGVMTPEIATERPAAMMESGPVGGIIASAQVGRALGSANVISFDMGGTTAKASLVRDGEPTMAPGYYVGGYASGHPVMLPMIDVVEVGAGGGSIAWLDDVGALKVGPQSAGADPGPICYRGGGAEPTITDANVVLGRLDPDNFLGGQMKLDAEGARRGIKEKIAEPLKLDPVAAAQAIVEIAIAKMSLAVREVSVAKGYDPRDFALVASGGAGPLHVVAIARELHIPKVVVPLFPSHFSALGHAAGGRAARFHPHLLFRSRQPSISQRSRSIHREMVAEGDGEPAPRARAPSGRFTSICAMSARNSPCRCRSASSSSSARTTPASAPPSTRSTSIATPTIRPTSRSRWSTSGSAMIGKRAEAELSRRAPRARARAPARQREVYFSRRAQAVALPGLSARGARRRQPRSPARRSSRSTAPRRCCSSATPARSAPSGELIITVGGA